MFKSFSIASRYIRGDIDIQASLSNLGNGWGYEMTPAELAKKDEFYSIYWSEYNLVKESGSPELYDKIHNRNNYADI